MDTTDRGKRRLVQWASWLGIGGIVASAVPFIRALSPSERTRTMGGPVRVPLAEIAPGRQVTVKWRGKPVWVLHRTAGMLSELLGLEPLLRDPASDRASQQPDYARNATRSIAPEYFICVGICTHLGCVPTFRPDVRPRDLGSDWLGGYFCPCHGSRFDLAGRVYKGVPAPTNLVVPPHHYLDDTTVVIGEDS